MPKQKNRMQITLKKSIEFHGFANVKIYIYITYGCFVTTKNEVFKLSHVQKNCTPTVPCSGFFVCSATQFSFVWVGGFVFDLERVTARFVC